MTEQTTWKPGDVANNHVLAADGMTWLYIPDQRTKNAKGNAWWLWFLLGGINAHIAYLNPKYRWIIIGVSIGALIMTGGLSGLLWLVSWAWLLMPQAYNAYREHAVRTSS